MGMPASIRELRRGVAVAPPGHHDDPRPLRTRRADDVDLGPHIRLRSRVAYWQQEPQYQERRRAVQWSPRRRRISADSRSTV